MCSNNMKDDFSTRGANKTNNIFKAVAYNIAIQGYLMFRTFFEIIVDFIFSLIWEDQKKEIPALEKKHSILLESAVSLAAKIRNRELKAVDLVTACIERIKSVNPIINAVTDERFEEALKEAEEIDRLIANGLPSEYFEKKPFLGVPFTTKESHAVRGLHQTLGIVSRRHIRAPEDADGVKLLREAGAIPLAVTNVPEINKWQESRNYVFGQTNNPHHAGRTTGGSSGGEAALCAAIATPIAFCSDIGGSTRMPAFYCGLYGYNPTAGHTSLKGLCFRTGEGKSMASLGFVSRHLGDLAPLTAVAAGEKAPLLDLNRKVDVQDLNIFYTEKSNDLRVSPICADLKDLMKKVVSALTETAARAPTPYYHAGFDYMFTLWKHLMTREPEVFARCLTNHQREASGLAELGKKLIGQSEFTLAAILKLLDEQVLPAPNAQWADALSEDLRDHLATTLGSTGVLLFPSAPSPAPYHYQLYTKPFNFAYWAIFNVVGFPAVQIPLGVNKAGLPLGIQVVAGPRQDAVCLAMAEHITSLLGLGVVPPCKIYD